MGLTVNYPDTYLGKLYSGKDHLAFYLSVAGVGASNLFYYDGNSISNFWLQNFDPRKFAIAGDKLFFSDHIDAEYGYPAEPDNYYQLFQSDFTIQGTKAVKILAVAVDPLLDLMISLQQVKRFSSPHIMTEFIIILLMKRKDYMYVNIKATMI